MFGSSQSGLRPALPPTLQPHAILDAAPRSDRRLSGVAAALVYCALAGGAVMAAKTGAQVVKEPITNCFLGAIPDLPDQPVEAQLRDRNEPAPAARIGDGLRPPDVAHSAQEVPDQVPQALPQEDHSRDGLFSPSMPVGNPQSTGGSPTGSPVCTAPSGNGTATTGEGSVDIPSESVSIRSQISPIYPPMARIARIQGAVVLRLTIDAQGVPMKVDTVSGPPALVGEAIKAAWQWRFEPARVAGRAMPASFLLTINFTLK